MTHHDLAQSRTPAPGNAGHAKSRRRGRIHWPGRFPPRARRQLLSALLVVLYLLILGVLNGCSVRTFVARSVGDALAEGGSVYASDDDMELVGDAVPFGLKTMEGLLEEVPEHRPLLVATARGFVQYAYVYVDLPALEADAVDAARARELRERAKRLYLRAQGYAYRALELRVPGWERRLRDDPGDALGRLRATEVPELYWAAVALSAAIAADKQDMHLVADLYLVEAMIRRALELDEHFDDGAIHQFLISFEGGRGAAMGGSPARARAHFERAMELSGGRRVAPLVALAESVSVRVQDRAEFTALLERALAFDVDAHPSHRLANLVAQKRARILLARADGLFL